MAPSYLPAGGVLAPRGEGKGGVWRVRVRVETRPAGVSDDQILVISSCLKTKNRPCNLR